MMDDYLVIKHPCFVRDGSEEKAMKMLGGLKQIERTFNMDNMRMQLNFRTGTVAQGSTANFSDFSDRLEGS